MNHTVLKPNRQWPAVRSRRRRQMISLTPLIDVVFILLVFFMLASSFQDWHTIELVVPSQTGASTESMEGALLVEVRPDGFRLSAEPVSLDILATRVEQHLEMQPDVRVLVKSAHGVALQETVRVLDALASVGASGLSLVREPEWKDSNLAL